MLQVTTLPDSSLEEPRPVLLCANGADPVVVLSGLPNEEIALRPADEAAGTEGLTRYNVRIVRAFWREARVSVLARSCASARALVNAQLDTYTYRTLGLCARAAMITMEPASTGDLLVIVSENEPGFWNDAEGWVVDLASATRYPDRAGRLPMSVGNDARYVRVKDAPVEMFQPDRRAFGPTDRRSRGWSEGLWAAVRRLKISAWPRHLFRRGRSNASRVSS